MRAIALSLSALLLAPAFAADAVVEGFNAEKTRIADNYKVASTECKNKAGKEAAECKKSADKSRQDALKAASKERDFGLKCRTSCGLVTDVKVDERDGDGSMVGTVGGGVAGAVIGRKLAGGSSSSGKNIATAVGAVGGALLGKKIEQKVTKHKVWVVSFTLYNGEASRSEFNEDPGMKAGDKIEVKDNKLVKR